jgi:hypothetical protein
MPKRTALTSKGRTVRLKFETVFLVLVWLAVIALVILYPRLGPS